jgi:chemosensory pili system protein ChpA (sensor histidine kinase/response regulator)
MMVRSIIEDYRPRRALKMSKQIMVVDDELQTRTLISILLQRRGFIVVEARDATTALQLLETTTPHLFIIDVMMPGMDGFELTRRIRDRAQTARTPIIIVSANQDVRNVRASSDVGANIFLPKTTLHPDLTARVRELLGIETPDA